MAHENALFNRNNYKKFSAKIQQKDGKVEKISISALDKIDAEQKIIKRERQLSKIITLRELIVKDPTPKLPDNWKLK